MAALDTEILGGTPTVIDCTEVLAIATEPGLSPDMIEEGYVLGRQQTVYCLALRGRLEEGGAVLATQNTRRRRCAVRLRCRCLWDAEVSHGGVEVTSQTFVPRYANELTLPDH